MVLYKNKSPQGVNVSLNLPFDPMTLKTFSASNLSWHDMMEAPVNSSQHSVSAAAQLVIRFWAVTSWTCDELTGTVLGGECRSSPRSWQCKKNLWEWDRHVLATFEKKKKQPTYMCARRFYVKKYRFNHEKMTLKSIIHPHASQTIDST